MAMCRGNYKRLLDLKKQQWRPGGVCVDNKVYVAGDYNLKEDNYEDTIEMLDVSGHFYHQE